MSFNVGDKVRIVREYTDGHLFWAPEMTMNIGKTGVITRIPHNNRYIVSIDGSDDWSYCEQSLEKVENEEENTMNNFTIEELTQAVAAALGQTGNTNTQNVQNTQAPTEEYWAKKSQFYGKVMEDGNIFNPYLHRRWLPSHYMNLIKNQPNHSAYKGIQKRYGFMYSIEWLIKEVDKLVFLQKVDPVAFGERGAFLLNDEIKQIIEDYVKKVKEYIETMIATKQYSLNARTKIASLFLSGYGWVKLGKVREIVEDHQVKEVIIKDTEYLILLNKLDELKDISFCASLKDIFIKLKAFKWIKLPHETKKSEIFIDAFMRQGAYYTMKHYILFEGYKLEGKTGSDAVQMLCDNSYKQGYKLHGMLKQMMKDNNHPGFENEDVIQ